MQLIPFLFFLAVTLRYIWNGTDNFTGKQWLKLVSAFVLILLATVLCTLLMKYLLSVWHFASVASVKLGLLKFFTSCLVVPAAKLAITGMNKLFSSLLYFHKNYNPVHYSNLSAAAKRSSYGLNLFLKSLVSLSSGLAFYGLWLAPSV